MDEIDGRINWGHGGIGSVLFASGDGGGCSGDRAGDRRVGARAASGGLQSGAGSGGWSFRKTLYGGDGQVEDHGGGGRLDPAVDAAKIRAIFVRPEFARMGLGSLLLEASERAAEAAGFTRFEMGSTLTGVALYTLKGYREVGRIAVPVGGGEAIGVVRMIKESARIS